MPVSDRPQSCPTHVRRPPTLFLLFFYVLFHSLYFHDHLPTSILFTTHSLYLFTSIVYIPRPWCTYDIFCNLTRPSSPITASLSLALDCRPLRLSLYDPAPGSSTRLLLAQSSLLATILVPAWPRSPPKPSAQTRPLHSPVFSISGSLCDWSQSQSFQKRQNDQTGPDLRTLGIMASDLPSTAVDHTFKW